MMNDIIVLLPGIGGSRLERDGKAIYDLSLRSLPSLIWNWVGSGLAYSGGSAKPEDGVVALERTRQERRDSPLVVPQLSERAQRMDVTVKPHRLDAYDELQASGSQKDEAGDGQPTETDEDTQ
jgi:hypothetical protein